jgi:hypothetical protein
MTSLKKQLNRITPARHYADNNRNEHYKFPLNWRESILYDETKKLPITNHVAIPNGLLLDLWPSDYAIWPPARSDKSAWCLRR